MQKKNSAALGSQLTLSVMQPLLVLAALPAAIFCCYEDLCKHWEGVKVCTITHKYSIFKRLIHAICGIDAGDDERICYSCSVNDQSGSKKDTREVTAAATAVNII